LTTTTGSNVNTKHARRQVNSLVGSSLQFSTPSVVPAAGTPIGGVLPNDLEAPGSLPLVPPPPEEVIHEVRENDVLVSAVCS
jgi:hypothetical protein